MHANGWPAEAGGGATMAACCRGKREVLPKRRTTERGDYRPQLGHPPPNSTLRFGSAHPSNRGLGWQVTCRSIPLQRSRRPKKFVAFFGAGTPDPVGAFVGRCLRDAALLGAFPQAHSALSYGANTGRKEAGMWLAGPGHPDRVAGCGPHTGAPICVS